MGAGDALGPGAGGGDGGDRERRRVGGQYAGFGHHPFKFGEKPLLDLHILDHGLEDDGAIGQVAQPRHQAQAGHRRLGVGAGGETLLGPGA